MKAAQPTQPRAVRAAQPTQPRVVRAAQPTQPRAFSKKRIHGLRAPTPAGL